MFFIFDEDNKVDIDDEVLDAIQKDTQYTESIFDSIRHVNDAGQEYWYARELQEVLEYS